MVGSACPYCKRSFSLLLWRHQCDVCQVVVCDDCVPKSNGLRRCPQCVPRRTATEHQQRSSNSEKPSILNEAEEREKRLRAVESRMKAAQQRGKPQEQRPVKPTTAQTTNTNGNINTTLPQAEVTVGVSRSSSANITEKATSSTPTQAQVDENPMLDAVLRRRQQEQSKMTANRNNSAEKTQLLAEILSILNQRGEEEPFGLRAMDETKLQSYLRYIKCREKGTDGI
ncbi:hypothetical protein LSM04_009413 [Trypanosoma melophagium]|uniref:uncharacterized protein n=1 Tax=Trypanosoma melophagium TaxID=715481 RepID=UPI00351A88E1|nr:hypothetical protein LSM04_009413 [Trypanosoma melophagium]